MEKNQEKTAKVSETERGYRQSRVKDKQGAEDKGTSIIFLNIIKNRLFVCINNRGVALP
jgi:hypothetical protein